MSDNLTPLKREIAVDTANSKKQSLANNISQNPPGVNCDPIMTPRERIIWTAIDNLKGSGYCRQLARFLDMDPKNLHRILKRLESRRLITIKQPYRSPRAGRGHGQMGAPVRRLWANDWELVRQEKWAKDHGQDHTKDHKVAPPPDPPEIPAIPPVEPQSAANDESRIYKDLVPTPNPESKKVGSSTLPAVAREELEAFFDECDRDFTDKVDRPTALSWCEALLMAGETVENFRMAKRAYLAWDGANNPRFGGFRGKRGGDRGYYDWRRIAMQKQNEETRPRLDGEEHRRRISMSHLSTAPEIQTLEDVSPPPDLPKSFSSRPASQPRAYAPKPKPPELSPELADKMLALDRGRISEDDLSPVEKEALREYFKFA